MNDPSHNTHWQSIAPDPAYEKNAQKNAFAETKDRMAQDAAEAKYREKIALAKAQQRALYENEIAAFNKVRNFINAVPEVRLIELYKKHTDSEFIPDFVANGVSHQLSSLEQMAAMGNQNAITCLVEISIRTASFLEQMAGHSDDETQVNVNDGKFIHRDRCCNESSTKNEDNVSDALHVLSKISDENMAELISMLDNKFPTNFILQDAFGMFTQILRHPPSASAAVDRSLDETTPQEDLEDLPTPYMLDLLLARLLNFRAQHLARESVRQVIASAEFWPIVAPSLKDGRAEQIELRLNDIGLGSELGYDTSGSTLGRKRQMAPDTATGYVFQIFRRIDQERNRALRMSGQQLEEYEHFERENKHQSHLGDFIQDETSVKLDEIRDWNSNTHWLRKAALLPPPLIENIKVWIEAVVAYERMMCAETIYSGEMGCKANSLSCRASIAASHLMSPCRECRNPVDDAQSAICRAEQDASMKTIMTLQMEELRLRETMEEIVDRDFNPKKNRKKIEDGLKVIWGQTSDVLPNPGINP